MSHPLPLALPPELREVAKAQIRAMQGKAGFLGEHVDDDLIVVGDDEQALFADHDRVRGHGRGLYVFDEREAASRRLDLSDTPDPAFGAIPMPPAPDGT